MGLTVSDQLDRWEQITRLSGDPQKSVAQEGVDKHILESKISEMDESDSDESNPLLDMGEDGSQSEGDESQDEEQLS